jgi:hypothetical protein
MKSILFCVAVGLISMVVGESTWVSDIHAIYFKTFIVLIYWILNFTNINKSENIIFSYPAENIES